MEKGAAESAGTWQISGGQRREPECYNEFDCVMGKIAPPLARPAALAQLEAHPLPADSRDDPRETLARAEVLR